MRRPDLLASLTLLLTLALCAGCAAREHARPSSAAVAPRPAGSAAPAAPAVSAAPAVPAVPIGRRAVTMTYLQAKPGRLETLRAYIQANWFAMDEIAVKRGLMINYQWLDTGEESGAWNAIVVVTYANDQGFAGIEAQWAEIKAAHQEVPVAGLRFADLGRVVDSKTFFSHAPFAVSF
jgi:hypothetical protein